MICSMVKNVAKTTIKLAPDYVLASTDMNNLNFEPKNDEQRRDLSENINKN